MTDFQESKLPESDRRLLAELSEPLIDPEEREVLAAPDLYQRFHLLQQEAESTLAHSYRVLEHFQAWRRPIDASPELEKVHEFVKELETFNDKIRDEIIAALGVKNVLILDTAEAAIQYIRQQPKGPRIAAASILKEYEERLSWVDDQLHQEESIQEVI